MAPNDTNRKHQGEAEMAQVLLTKVNKFYDGKVHAVKNVNLEIRDKEFMVFVGPSGCGKTTTLRMVAGLESISDGEIRIGDTVVNDLPPMDRDIAMVFQNYALYPHMSVFDNMAFGLKMRKFAKDEIEKRVKQAAAILDIGQYLERKPRQLSGGQRQRVALGRAIVRHPQVFLFDEPLSNLDAKLRVQMRVEIKKLHNRLATTSIYVTHDQVEAMTLGDRVVVMKDGIVQQVGEPLELYNNPANKFVAGFIGSPAMNFINVTIENGGGSVRARNAGLDIRVPDHLVQRVEPFKGKKLALGIRPENLRIANGSDPADYAFDTTAEVVEQLGAEILLDAKVADQTLVASIEPTARIRPQDKVKLALDPSRLHFFDGESERVL
jgi:multiple sugar transport system ATP-binding protein